MQSLISRVLDPANAYAEVQFGLIMALTFTLGATLIVDPAGETFERVVFGAVTCNVAWGIIDGAFYILGQIFELGRRGLQIQQVKTAMGREEAMDRIREVFDSRVADVTTSEERDRLYDAIHRLVLRMTPPARRPTREGLLGALAVFVLVSATGLPVLLPALLIPDTRLALRITNGLLVICLFFTGYGMARAVRGRKILVGLCVSVVGLALVGVAKVLGG